VLKEVGPSRVRTRAARGCPHPLGIHVPVTSYFELQQARQSAGHPPDATRGQVGGASPPTWVPPGISIPVFKPVEGGEMGWHCRGCRARSWLGDGALGRGQPADSFVSGSLLCPSPGKRIHRPEAPEISRADHCPLRVAPPPPRHALRRSGRCRPGRDRSRAELDQAIRGDRPRDAGGGSGRSARARSEENSRSSSRTQKPRHGDESSGFATC
jgi:hypothetical protein